MAVAEDELVHRARTYRVAGQTIEVYVADDADAVMEQAIARDDPAPYGAVVWSSALALAERLPGLDIDGPIIDVGAGCGLFSLAAAACGHRVVALDYCPVSLELLRRAAAAQQLSTIEVRDFDIGQEDALPEGALYVFADVLYEQAMVGPMVRRMKDARRHGAVWVGEPDRTWRHLFETQLRQAGLEPAPERVSVTGGDDAEAVLVYCWDRM